MYTIKNLTPAIIHIEFDSIQQMSTALGRVQEFAENPKFQHQIVTWSRLKKYHKSKGNRRTFNNAWLGFNIPGWAFKEFYQKCDHFKPKEKEVIEAVLALKLPSKFYVITDADKSSRKERNKASVHEFAHAMYATNDDYRATAQILLNEYPETPALLLKIKRMGIYSEDTWEDELHAYITTDTLSTSLERFGIRKDDTTFLELKSKMEQNLSRFMIEKESK